MAGHFMEHRELRQGAAPETHLWPWCSRSWQQGVSYSGTDPRQSADKRLVRNLGKRCSLHHILSPGLQAFPFSFLVASTSFLVTWNVGHPCRPRLSAATAGRMAAVRTTPVPAPLVERDGQDAVGQAEGVRCTGSRNLL